MLLLGLVAAGATLASSPWPAPRGHAYYKLSSLELANASWPRGFEHYSLFVANPGFSAAELARVKATVPGSKILAYTDMSWAYIGTGCSESNGNFSAYFNTCWAITDLRTGQPVCPFGAAATPLDPSPKITPVAAAVLMKESADALVRYHTERTLAAPYDGLYMDDFEYSFPASWAANVVVLIFNIFSPNFLQSSVTISDDKMMKNGQAFTNGSFDTNGDGTKLCSFL